jgi:hypothetical protein
LRTLDARREHCFTAKERLYKEPGVGERFAEAGQGRSRQGGTIEQVYEGVIERDTAWEGVRDVGERISADRDERTDGTIF